ncbi:unnamed protein product [Knipowitschia caucasica]|uniref:Nectin cell adhesion molecule 3 n=1 Tax=Knipowitschia caucasica TaxID=637954 RepID=A0AAV2MC34_KNICA
MEGLVRRRFLAGCGRFPAVVCLLVCALAHGAAGQKVKVEAEVLSYPGQTVNLRCAFTDTTGVQLTMVTWIYEPKEGERINIAVFHPSFDPNYPESPMKGRVSFAPSPPNLASPSIQIQDVRMTDEGKYICEFATYPSGNEQGITYLVMLAKPQNAASTVTVEAGAKKVVVARCESLNGRPAAKITWVTTANGNATTVSTPAADNTVSITSEYEMIPTAKDNGRDISCVVEHRTQTKPESFPLKLAVQYAPQVEIKGYDNNWYMGRTRDVTLTCNADGNPLPTTVMWKAMSGEMPDTVLIKDKQLTVLKVDDAVNTTFVCEVKNRIGLGKDQVTVFVREPTVDPSNAGVVAGAVIGSLLALLLVAALVAVLVTRSRRQQQGYRANGSGDMKTRIFGGGKKSAKNGTNGGTGTGVGGANNNGPMYGYNESSSHHGEKNNHHHQPLTVGSTTPSAQDILLSNELDDAERRKFDELEEDERYDHFGGGGGAPILQLRPHNQEHIMGDYLDDDMESQRDGSVISRTAVYV